MFTPFLSATVQDAFLAQAGSAASVIAVILAGVVCLLVWQLWQARDSYSEDLAEQSHQVLEEQNKARRALEEKEALAKDGLAKSEMLATLSREIRAHLNGVIGSADLLMDNSLKPRQRELLITLRSSAEALHQSLNDVLEYSSIETGAIDLERAPFDLRQPLADLVETLSPQALLKGLELVLIIAPDVPLQAEGDAVRLRQLLHNMMSNSVKFTSSGRVVLRVELPKGSAAPSSKGSNWLHFSISDTGPVLTEEELDTIFERFGQSDAPSPRKFGGSGLELAISKKLVELMGGRIGARALPDSGIEFWAVLPVSDSKAGSPPAPAVPSSFHVVVLDDLSAARVAVSAMLSRLGIDHDVTDTEAKAEGLLRDALEANAAQPAILVDESVIKDSAEELARMVAEGSPLQATRIIVMSPDPESLRPATLPFPVAAVVRKPLVRAELLIEALNKTPGSVSMSRSPFDLVSEPPFRGGPLVLVVDDDEISRSVSSQLLGRLGCRVELAASGAEAIARTGNTTFELVFMDCHMPDMDGFTATKRIRAAVGNQTPPIVALTANTAVGDREKCFAAGMCDFVAKPARKAELARVLKTWTDLDRTAAK